MFLCLLDDQSQSLTGTCWERPWFPWDSRLFWLVRILLLSPFPELCGNLRNGRWLLWAWSISELTLITLAILEGDSHNGGKIVFIGPSMDWVCVLIMRNSGTEQGFAVLGSVSTKCCLLPQIEMNVSLKTYPRKGIQLVLAFLGHVEWWWWWWVSISRIIYDDNHWWYWPASLPKLKSEQQFIHPIYSFLASISNSGDEQLNIAVWNCFQTSWMCHGKLIPCWLSLERQLLWGEWTTGYWNYWILDPSWHNLFGTKERSLR